MTGETALVIVLAVGCVVLGVLGLVRTMRRRAAAQSYTILRFNSIFGMVVGARLLVLYFGVYRK